MAVLDANWHAAVLENAQRIDLTFIERGHVQLLAPLHATVNGQLFTVPIGFASDGASIPAALYSIIGHPFSGTLLFSCLVHDALCRAPHAFAQRVVSRWFYHDLRAHGNGRWRAGVMWAAVRWFGPRW